MDEKKRHTGVSRRKFLQGVGTGIIGTTILPDVLKGTTGKAASELHEGKELISLMVNGKKVRVLVEPGTTLVELLRNQLKLTGTKVVCNEGHCGGCTVVLDGKAVYSCLMLALDADGKEVLTIEGLLNGEKLHPIQEAFIEHDGYQCGFCTPGQIMATEALLRKHKKLTPQKVKEGLAGNICRCAAYPHIVDSVLAAAEKIWD